MACRGRPDWRPGSDLRSRFGRRTVCLLHLQPCRCDLRSRVLVALGQKQGTTPRGGTTEQPAVKPGRALLLALIATALLPTNHEFDERQPQALTRIEAWEAAHRHGLRGSRLARCCTIFAWTPRR